MYLDRHFIIFHGVIIFGNPKKNTSVSKETEITNGYLIFKSFALVAIKKKKPNQTTFSIGMKREKKN